MNSSHVAEKKKESDVGEAFGGNKRENGGGEGAGSTFRNH